MKKIFIVFALLLSVNSHAVWINVTGTVVNIVTYAHTDTVLVTLSVPGQDVVECVNKTQFAISSTTSEERRARMYAMLLSAKASETPITITYNDVGSCEAYGSTTNAYRTVLRMY
ncbi:MAG: hypothetical protein AAF290_07390 [Pseudomonadota bacterium]